MGYPSEVPKAPAADLQLGPPAGTAGGGPHPAATQHGGVRRHCAVGEPRRGDGRRIVEAPGRLPVPLVLGSAHCPNKFTFFCFFCMRVPVYDFTNFFLGSF